jgi:hypothetical protein
MGLQVAGHLHGFLAAGGLSYDVDTLGGVEQAADARPYEFMIINHQDFDHPLFSGYLDACPEGIPARGMVPPGKPTSPYATLSREVYWCAMKINKMGRTSISYSHQWIQGKDVPPGPRSVCRCDMSVAG